MGVFQAVPSLLMEPTLECLSELPKKPHAVLVIDKQNADDMVHTFASEQLWILGAPASCPGGYF